MATIGTMLNVALAQSKLKWWTGYERVARTMTVHVPKCSQAEFDLMFPAHLATSTHVVEKKTTKLTERTLSAAQANEVVGDLGLKVVVHDKGDWATYKPGVRRGEDKAVINRMLVSYSTGASKITIKADVINAGVKVCARALAVCGVKSRAALRSTRPRNL
jgi:hypothetical protein